MTVGGSKPPFRVSAVSNYCSRAGATTREGRGPYQRMQSHDPLFVNQWLLCSVGLVVLLCLLGSECLLCLVLGLCVCDFQSRQRHAPPIPESAAPQLRYPPRSRLHSVSCDRAHARMYRSRQPLPSSLSFSFHPTHFQMGPCVVIWGDRPGPYHHCFPAAAQCSARPGSHSRPSQRT